MPRIKNKRRFWSGYQCGGIHQIFNMALSCSVLQWESCKAIHPYEEKLGIENVLLTNETDQLSHPKKALT